MSNRFYEYDKGSSRSTRDDSRRPNEKKHRNSETERRSHTSSRSRSRSPRRRHSPEPRSSRHSDKSHRSRSRDLDHHGSRDRHRSPRRSKDEPEEVPAPPPPPRITKISIDFSKPKAPIKMNLAGPSIKAPVPKPTIASVFNADDDDDEPEEMPAEARMRMRNIGRETPTSAGPNSFGKTKQGFCDSKKVFEKNLKQALEPEEEKKTLPKFPQTIYKLKGP